MGQACSNQASVAASEPAPILTHAYSSKDSTRPGVLNKEGRRSTGDKKVSVLPVADVLSCDGTSCQESVKGVEDPPAHQHKPHPDSPIACSGSQAESPPFAEDPPLLSPGREEPMQHCAEADSEAGGAAATHSKAGSTRNGAMTEHSIQSNSSMSEKSFLTVTAAADAIDDEVSQSVLQGVPSAAISRFPTQSVLSVLSVDGAKASDAHDDDECEPQQAQHNSSTNAEECHHISTLSGAGQQPADDGADEVAGAANSD